MKILIIISLMLPFITFGLYVLIFFLYGFVALILSLLLSFLSAWLVVLKKELNQL